MREAEIEYYRDMWSMKDDDLINVDALSILAETK